MVFSFAVVCTLKYNFLDGWVFSDCPIGAEEVEVETREAAQKLWPQSN